MTPTPPTTPLRAVVLANSVGLMVCSRSHATQGGAYPHHLPEALAVGGQPAEVWSFAKVMGMVDDGVRDWERAVFTTWPHLVVINYGIQETYPIFFPKPVHQQAWGLSRTDRPVDRAMTSLLQTRWRWIQWASNRLDHEWWRGQVSITRFGHQFRRLVDLTLTWTAASVVVVGMHEPNVRMMKLSGAYPHRRERLQRIMLETVEAHPRAGFVDIQRVVDAVDPTDFQTALPDGLHLVPEGHRVLAGLIAEEYYAIQSRLGDRGPTG